jgi:hypothetical protein
MQDVSIHPSSIRSKGRWRLYALVACLALAAALVAVLVSERNRTERRVANVRKLLAIVDQDYQRCALGDVPPPAELARRELNARVTGKLTPRRARACAEIVASKLESLSHLEHDDDKLHSFFLPVYVSDSFYGVGLCEHVEARRTWATKLGVDVVVPDCSLELPLLEPTLTRDEDEEQAVHLRGDSVTLDVWPSRWSSDMEHPGTDHVLRRTTDGKTWDESPPLRTLDELHVASDGTQAFAYAFANAKESARYHVYDGKKWHVGALVADGGFLEAFRRTESGWTLVTAGAVPAVIRLDSEMDHVLEKTPMRALADRWGLDMEHAAMIDDTGDVATVTVTASGDALQVESRFVPVGAKPEPPTLLKIDRRPGPMTVRRCRSGSTEFVAISGVATLVSRDSGRSFAQIPGGHLVDPGIVACTAQHLYVASDRAFTACDLDRCITQDVALPGTRPLELDLELRGEQPLLFVTLDGLAVLLAPRADTGELAPISIWRWNYIMPYGPLVRIDGIWFAPRKLTPF